MAFPLTGVVLFASLLGITGITGCAHNDTPETAASTSGGGTDPASVGKGVFTSSGCMNCHSVGGQGGRRGPNLSKVGADPQHTAEWLAAYVKDPKSQNPTSRMPAFGNRINDQNLQALGAYLASLK